VKNPPTIKPKCFSKKLTNIFDNLISYLYLDIIILNILVKVNTFVWTYYVQTELWENNDDCRVLPIGV
jgi:hypothetical protein